MQLKLYHYWRSSCSWRVRWALQLKNLSCEFEPINLLSDEPESPKYLERNPTGYVPLLEVQEGSRISYLGESVAILDWLEESFPHPSLLSKDRWIRAKMRQLAEVINSGTQPLQNLNVIERYSPDKEAQKSWSQEWIQRGLRSYETLVAETAGKFSVGDSPSFPDLFLIPQCYNALRFEVDLTSFPILYGIYQRSLDLESCQRSSPMAWKP